MDEMTKALLRDAGFESGTVSELLGLSAAQEAIIESKIRLTALLREERKNRKWSQAKLAEEIGTRQQVVARAEMGHRSVTLDLLFRALLTMGIDLKRIAQELEAGETFLSEQHSGQNIELVEIAPIAGLIRPERVAANESIDTVKPYLKMVRQESMQEKSKSTNNKTNPKSHNLEHRTAMAA
jgi:HTH-type transcriptional regulator/antitoxin HipB